MSRILIADANEDAAESLALLLHLNGHLTVTAYTGPDALEMASLVHPEAVFLSIHLPRMSGHEVCRQLRLGLHGARPELLIALTGHGRESDREATRAAGFDFHLLKPAEPEVVLNMLKLRRPAEQSNLEPVAHEPSNRIEVELHRVEVGMSMQPARRS